jgi:alpha-ketoglutarate-dependent taurine dioxygenase
MREHREQVDQAIASRGGVLLRGLGIDSAAVFNQIVTAFSPELLDYVNRSTPRTKLGGKLYTATEYPADKTIPLHNESSYADVWPARIFFYSAVVAMSGGNTPVADSRRVYQGIDAAVRERFERLGVMYVRNYTPGIDLPWQEVFQTDQPSAVEDFCQQHDIVWRWHGNGPGPELTTFQRRPASLTHPVTGEPVWFNQAHLFHLSALAPAEQQSLVAELGTDHLPRNAFYGDGSPIELDLLAHVREVYAREAVVFQWQRGDVLLLDNLLFAHGRTSFNGPRKVVVAMA